MPIPVASAHVGNIRSARFIWGHALGPMRDARAVIMPIDVACKISFLNDKISDTSGLKSRSWA